MYFKDQSKGNARGKRNNNRLSILSDTSGRDAGSPFIKFYELEPAQVVNVILDEDDPDFETYADIGKVKFRFLYSDTKRDDEDLPYAYPANTNAIQFPLVNEFVVVAEYMGDYYYDRRLNVFNFINNNIYSDFGEITKKPASQKDSLETYQKSEDGFAKNKKQENPYEKFTPSNDTVHPVKQEEGDTVYYGRFGNFIKLSSNEDNEPNIKIIGGQSPEDQQEADLRQPIRENISKDLSSIWLTANEEVEFSPSTVEENEHLKTYPSPPDTYGGEQIIINSDRLVFNSKNRDIFLYAGTGIGMTAREAISIDAVKNLNLSTAMDHNLYVTGSQNIEVVGNATHVYDNNVEEEIGNEWNVDVGTSATVRSPEIELGESGDTQKMVLGEDLNEALLNLITTLLENQATFVQTAVGPGTLNPPIVQALTKLKTALQTEDLLSEKNRSQ